MGSDYLKLYGCLNNSGSDLPLVAGHRGSPGGNVPCNTIPAFNASLMEGADIIELDVSKSCDGKLFVFHPGMESAHIGKKRLIAARKEASVEKLRFLNQDNVKTSYKVNTLEETLLFLKDKCVVNVDKFWTAPELIAKAIRNCGMEKQVIIKTPAKDRHFDEVEKFAPDFMYMPVISQKDSATDGLLKRNINLIGAEVLFETETDEVCSDSYIEKMHQNGLLLWGNAIVYNEKSVISAGHTDDLAVSGNEKDGWGWFCEKKFDIIQTDRVALLKNYLKRG